MVELQQKLYKVRYLMLSFPHRLQEKSGEHLFLRILIIQWGTIAASSDEA